MNFLLFKQLYLKLAIMSNRICQQNDIVESKEKKETLFLCVLNYAFIPLLGSLILS